MLWFLFCYERHWSVETDLVGAKKTANHYFLPPQGPFAIFHPLLLFFESISKLDRVYLFGPKLEQ
jgi:hypothetical protein